MFETEYDFSFDELHIINTLTDGERLSKSELINKIFVAIAATPEAEIKETLKTIYRKVHDLEQYDSFIANVPFDTPIAEFDEDEEEFEDYADWGEDDVNEFTELILALDRAASEE